MQATRFLLLISALAAACSSSSQESRVAVTNRGRGTAAPAATRVEFNGDPASGVVRQTHFVPAHAVDSFEDITVESPKPVHESGRC